jgi:hypothetical protein
MVTAGVGVPEAASWFGVYSTSVSLPVFVIHKSPETSKATPLGSLTLDPFAEMVTAGIGLPEAASWLGVYSTRVVLPVFATHRPPEVSNAKP